MYRSLTLVLMAWKSFWRTAISKPIAVAIVGLTALNANAIGVVDQSNIVSPAARVAIFDSLFGGQQFGQTFTVGLAGILSEVSISVEKRGTPLADLELELQGVSGGLPDGNVLITSSLLAGSVINGLNVFDISFANLSVGVGDVYAIVLKSSVSAGNDYLAHANLLNGDFYVGGQAVTNASGIYGTGSWAVLGDPVSNPFDAIFQTKVMPVPEAETYAMMLVGLGLVGMVARRRKQVC